MSKMISALRLLARPREFAYRFGRNLRAARLRMAKDRLFAYRAACGHLFVCDPSAPTSVHLYLERGRHEENDESLCSAWLERGDTVVDAGANNGQFSFLFAGVVGKEGRVIAIEGAPETAGRLGRCAAWAGLTQIEVENACLGESAGETGFMVADAPGAGDVFQSMKLEPWRKGYKEIRVRSIAMDGLLASKGIGEDEVALWKMDIQGAEPLALRGAQRMLGGPNPPLCLFEVSPRDLREFGCSPKDIWEWFPLERFDLYVSVNPMREFKGKSGFVRLHSPQSHAWDDLSNLVAVPKSGHYAKRQEKISRILSMA